MKKNFTKIAIVLDRSGSMSSVRKATVDAINEFISSQKQLPGEASLKLVQFDDVYEQVLDAPINLIAPLTEASFVPRGWTALYDAIGTTIDSLGQELAAMPESSRPDKVIVVVITDGGENSSRKFTQAEIKQAVTRQRELYKWEFVFLGANQDAVLTAQGFNIPRGSSITYNSNHVALRNTVNSVSNYVGTYRSGGIAAFSPDDRLKSTV